MFLNKLKLLIILLFFLKCSSCYRILGLFPMQGKSHYNMFEPIMKELAKRGHTVDVLNHFPQKKPVERFNDISVSGTVPVFTNNFTLDLVSNFDTVDKMVDFIFTVCGRDLCRTLFASDPVKQLRNNAKKGKYDLIMTEIFGTDCFLGFAGLFNVPVIALSTSPSFPWGNDRMGIPDNPSYIPNTFLDYFAADMTIWHRMINTAALLYTKLAFYFQSHLPSKQMVREFFGQNVDYEFLINNISMLFLNTHVSLNDARPYPPNVLEIGGVHIDSNYTKDLEMEKVLNENPNGVVLFSMGSMICTETFEEEKKKALLEAFGQLKETVIWKGKVEDFPKPIPKNIIFMRWVPQLQILCHPNTKLFITHGGLLGTHEAVYCGVPLLIMPFFGDQPLNAQRYEKNGIGLHISYQNDMTAPKILNKLQKLLNDQKYVKNVKHLSTLFRDRPVSARDAAVYWVEYVIKHKGAPHLKPHSTKLYWFQLLLLDVIAVVLIAVFLICFIIYKLGKLVFSKCWSKANKKTKKVKKS